MRDKNHKLCWRQGNNCEILDGEQVEFTVHWGGMNILPSQSVAKIDPELTVGELKMKAVGASSLARGVSIRCRHGLYFLAWFLALAYPLRRRRLC